MTGEHHDQLRLNQDRDSQLHAGQSAVQQYQRADRRRARQHHDDAVDEAGNDRGPQGQAQAVRRSSSSDCVPKPDVSRRLINTFEGRDSFNAQKRKQL